LLKPNNFTCDFFFFLIDNLEGALDDAELYWYSLWTFGIRKNLVASGYINASSFGGDGTNLNLSRNPVILDLYNRMSATQTPTTSPSYIPSTVPSAPPSAIPTAKPSATPSAPPSTIPTAKPSATPSAPPPPTPTANPACSGVPSGTYKCPGSMTWSGLSLDCTQLTSNHDGNEMCCLSCGSCSTKCAVGGNNVGGCSSTSAPLLC
jgi:hypothetical protein